MSTEVIVLRAFMGDQVVAEEMLAHGFAPELMPTREGRKVAETLLALRKDATAPNLENLRRALDQRGRLRGGFKRYLVELERMPCCSRLHAVAHLQMLKLDAAMSHVDRICQAISASGASGTPAKGLEGPGRMPPESPRGALESLAGKGTSCGSSPTIPG